MFPLIFPDALTVVYATLADLNRSGLAPGILRSSHAGGRVFKLVKNLATVLTVGDVVVHDVLTNDTDSEVKQPVTAALDQMAGVAMGAIPASGFGWIQVYGYNAAARVKGDVVAITAGDSLKGLTATFTAVKSTASGTTPEFQNYLRALDAATAADTTVEVVVSCLGF